jgi:rod shape-determining protein MreD
MGFIEAYNIKPNLFIILIVSIALLRGNVEGAAVGFFTGLVQDLISGRAIGLYALLGLYIGFIMGSVNKRLYRENILISIFFTFIATIFYELVVFLTILISGINTDFIEALKKALTTIILPEAIYNGIMSIPIFILSIRLNYRLEDMKKSSRKY